MQSSVPYKSYIDIRNLPTIPKEPVDEEMTKEPDQIAHKPSTSSSMTPCPEPSTHVDPNYINCAICGSDQVWLKRKGTQVWGKFCLCTAESAEQFLDAMRYHKDDVYDRCADPNGPEDIYAANLYCHNICFKEYVSKSHSKESM